VSLPDLGREAFARRLRRAAPEPLSGRVVDVLWAHYELLGEWGRGLSLIGPGTATEAVERHYGESLAALAWIPRDRPGHLLDVGSGAGFPGFVIAAARPRLEVLLVESRQRKWAFLRAAAARAALPVHCLDARVSTPLPTEIPEELDYVTLRAVKLPTVTLTTLLARLAPTGALHWWCGEEDPELPSGWTVTREIALPGSERRRILEVGRAS
jgi:16S rRNA (guanine(527)-N(7))-methyltransferase RsmG